MIFTCRGIERKQRCLFTKQRKKSRKKCFAEIKINVCVDEVCMRSRVCKLFYFFLCSHEFPCSQQRKPKTVTLKRWHNREALCKHWKWKVASERRWNSRMSASVRRQDQFSSTSCLDYRTTKSSLKSDPLIRLFYLPLLLHTNTLAPMIYANVGSETLGGI